MPQRAHREMRPGEDDFREAVARFDLEETFRREERAWRRDLLPKALFVTVLVHAVLIFWILHVPSIVGLGEIQAARRPVEISLEAPPVFVATNPEAPREVPAQTNFTSDRDQVSAQPDPLPEDKGETPTSEGTIEDSNAVLSGTLEPQPPAAPAGLPEPSETPAPVAEAMPAPAPLPPPPTPQVNLPELPKAPESDEGLLRAAPTENPEPAQLAQQQAAAPPQGVEQPLPRPQVRLRQLPQVTALNAGGVRRPGVVAINSKFSEFGAYEQRMFEAIVKQWYLLCERHAFTAGDIGTSVEVNFTVNTQGEISDFEIKRTSASNTATMFCQDAVLSRAPFGVWTEQMTRMLGETTPVSIRFFYQ